MKVKLISNGKTAEFETSYAARLIEQGKAVPVAEKPASEKPRAKAAAKAEEKAADK